MQLERLLLLARFEGGEGSAASRRSSSAHLLQPLLWGALSHDYALAAVRNDAEDGGGGMGGGGGGGGPHLSRAVPERGVGDVRACQLRQACAAVLSELLRRRLSDARASEQPALSVHAALAALEAVANRLEREAHGEAAGPEAARVEDDGVVASVLGQVVLDYLCG